MDRTIVYCIGLCPSKLFPKYNSKPSALFRLPAGSYSFFSVIQHTKWRCKIHKSADKWWTEFLNNQTLDRYSNQTESYLKATTLDPRHSVWIDSALMSTGVNRVKPCESRLAPYLSESWARTNKDHQPIMVSIKPLKHQRKNRSSSTMCARVNSFC